MTPAEELSELVTADAMSHLDADATGPRPLEAARVDLLLTALPGSGRGLTARVALHRAALDSASDARYRELHRAAAAYWRGRLEAATEELEMLLGLLVEQLPDLDPTVLSRFETLTARVGGEETWLGDGRLMVLLRGVEDPEARRLAAEVAVRLSLEADDAVRGEVPEALVLDALSEVAETWRVLGDVPRCNGAVDQALRHAISWRQSRFLIDYALEAARIPGITIAPDVLAQVEDVVEILMDDPDIAEQVIAELFADDSTAPGGAPGAAPEAGA